MTFECKNCGHTEEKKEVKIKLDEVNKTKRDDTECPNCNSKMERTDEELDLSTTRMSKPFSDRGKKFYSRKKK
jgi:Zn finger protein HypA/HybF involved in hydrogenase expression